MFVDSHTHLTRLEISPEEAVEGATEAGVLAVVNIGTDVEDSWGGGEGGAGGGGRRRGGGRGGGGGGGGTRRRQHRDGRGRLVGRGEARGGAAERVLIGGD